MRRLTAYLPALVVAAVAAYLLAWPESRQPLAEVASSAVALRLDAGRHVDLDLSLRALRPMQRIGPGPRPTLFLHLKATDGQTVRQFDHPLDEWIDRQGAAGQIVVDRTTLARSLLDPPLPAGRYDLVVGLWDPERDRRFRVRVDGDAVKRWTATTVEVPAAAESGPRVALGTGWSPVEPTDSVHSRSRTRWTGPTDLTLAGNTAPIEVRLVVDMLPEVVSAELEATVQVACTGLSLPLRHRWQELRFQIPADTGDGCAIQMSGIAATQTEPPISELSGWLYSITWAEPSEVDLSASCVGRL